VCRRIPLQRSRRPGGDFPQLRYTSPRRIPEIFDLPFEAQHHVFQERVHVRSGVSPALLVHSLGLAFEEVDGLLAGPS
jgi:hypothetical protein